MKLRPVCFRTAIFATRHHHAPGAFVPLSEVAESQMYPLPLVACLCMYGCTGDVIHTRQCGPPIVSLLVICARLCGSMQLDKSRSPKRQLCRRMPSFRRGREGRNNAGPTYVPCARGLQGRFRRCLPNNALANGNESRACSFS